MQTFADDSVVKAIPGHPFEGRTNPTHTLVLDKNNVKLFARRRKRRGRGRRQRRRNRHRPPRPPLAPAHEDAGAQHLVGLRGGGLVPVRVLAVGLDAVADLHAQRAVSVRGGVGATERARPQGVGVDAFGELEVFFGDATTHHDVQPDAVTQGLMRRRRVCFLELLAACLQYVAEKCFMHLPRKLVRDCVSVRSRTASIRKPSKYFPNTRVPRDARP
jgi:hypothetical protein